MRSNKAATCIAALVVLLAAGCSPPKSSSHKPSSPPPRGEWQAVVETSAGQNIEVLVDIQSYSSDADVQSVANSSGPGDLKKTVETFEPHGEMLLSRKVEGQDGKVTVTMWPYRPQFVIARLSGQSWKITIASGSAFAKERDAGPDDIGILELTVPAKGTGGSARLYMATQAQYNDDDGLTVTTVQTEAKDLKITDFKPMTPRK
jgi:hypothetical protein